MTETVEDLKSAVRFYHNQADYYKEKNEKLKSRLQNIKPNVKILLTD